MKKRLLAALLAVALVCAVPVLADEASKPAVREDQELAAEAENSAAGPDDKADRAEYVPDEVGFVSFENIERRIRRENLNVDMMDHNIDSLDAMDYDKIEAQLEAGLAGINAQILMMEQGMETEPIGAQFAITSLKAQAKDLEDQLAAIREGDMRHDNALTISKMEAGQDAIVMGGETLFLALKAMETQYGALQRQLTALNRTVEEMELRYQMGQISALTLAEVKTGRTSLISGMNTLKMNIDNQKAQLEYLLGAKITGEITLGAVPEVTQAQLAAMDVEADWKSCKRKNHDIYAAKYAMSDAAEDFEAAEKAYSEDSYEYRVAENTYDAAGAAYEDALQSRELKFRQLYAQVHDHKQILESAKESLALEEKSFQASELKYRQGTISHNAYLAAQDELRSAAEAVENAANDLFSAYNTYCWAEGHGILN